MAVERKGLSAPSNEEGIKAGAEATARPHPAERKLSALFRFRFDMDMGIGNMMFFRQRLFHEIGDIVPFFDGKFRVDGDGDVHERPVAEHSRPQAFHVEHPVDRPDRFMDGAQFLLIEAVRQKVQGLPEDVPGGFQDDEPDDGGRQRIEPGHAEAGADDSDQGADADQRVGKVIVRSGEQSLAVYFLCQAEIQPENEQHDDGAEQGDPSRRPIGGNLLPGEKFAEGVIQDFSADEKHEKGCEQGSDRFRPEMAVTVILIRRLPGDDQPGQNGRVSDHVRQVVEPVRLQSFRMAEAGCNDFDNGEADVGGDADPNAFFPDFQVLVFFQHPFLQSLLRGSGFLRISAADRSAAVKAGPPAPDCLPSITDKWGVGLQKKYSRHP